MILRIFKTSQPLSWVLIVLLIVALRVLLFVFFYPPVEVSETTNLFGLWVQQFNAFSPWVSHFLSTVIVLFTGFYFNKIAQSIRILKSINYLLVFFTGIFMSFYPADLVLSPMIITTPILVYSYYLILDQPKGMIQVPLVFNSAFFIGLAWLLFFPAGWMFLILLIALGYLNQSGWRPFVIAIIGFLTPWLFFDVLVFAFGSVEFLKINDWKTHFEGLQISNYAPFYFSLSFVGLVLFHAVLYFRASSHSIIKIQKSLMLNFIYLLIAVVFTGFFTDAKNYLVGLMVIPVSILFTVFHLETKKWWVGDLAFLGLLGVMYWNYVAI